ncbi:hypothetical protein ACTXT7_013260 [Hymenolepis weldensis]
MDWAKSGNIFRPLIFDSVDNEASFDAGMNKNTCIEQCYSYLDVYSKRMGRAREKDNFDQIFEDKYLCYSDVNEKSQSYAIAPLLSFPHFTVLDLSNTKLDKDFLHLCGIGLKTGRALRALILRDAKCDGDYLGYLLRCLPITSHIRKIDLRLQKESRDANAYKIIGSLNQGLFERLIDLRLSGQCSKDSPFLDFFVNKNSELRSLTLTRVHQQALDRILQCTPKLRSLTVEDSSLEIAAISKSILDSKLTNLEVLTLPDSRMDEASDTIIEQCFASLCRLQVLNLSGCSGKNGGRVLRSILNGVGAVETHVYGKLDLNITCYNLKEKFKPVNHLTSLTITIKESHDKNGSLKAFLSNFPNLESLTVGGELKSTGKTLDGLADVLASKESRISYLTLRKICGESDLCEFLEKLIERGKKLKHLDIRSYVLSHDQMKCMLELIKATNPNEPFSLFFKYYGLRKHAGYAGQVDGLVRRKWPSLKVCFPYQLYVADNGQAMVHMDFTKVQSEDSEKICRSEVSNPRRLLELEKFEESVLNPSEEFTKSSLELSSSAIKTYRKMPKRNLEQLTCLYPKVHQAKLGQDECRKVSSLQTSLLETALDPEQCSQSLSKLLNDVKSAIESSVKSTCEDCCQEMKNVIYKESIQSFTPLLNYEFTLNAETREFIAKSLHQQVENSFRTMIMDLRIKVAEQMLSLVMKSLKEEFENCFKDFPSKEELEPMQPAQVNDVYQRLSNSTNERSSDFEKSYPVTTKLTSLVSSNPYHTTRWINESWLESFIESRGKSQTEARETCVCGNDAG